MDLSNSRFRVLLEPRGFIRFLQFILSIVAFATASGFSTIVKFHINCDNKDPFSVDYPVDYPFRIDEHENTFTDCANVTRNAKIEGDFSPSAQWFVSVGVFSFLLSLASMVFYVLFESSYRLSHERIITIGDFAITCLFTFFWLTAASAWAKAANDLKHFTSQDYLVKLPPFDEVCTKPEFCRTSQLASSKMSASVAFGFLNMFLWASNIWFVYKESPLHPEPNKGVESGNIQQGAPQNTM